jgi:feruloyl esterase
LKTAKLFLTLLTAWPALAASCEDLASLSLPHATITSARVLSEPKSCRVAATLRPSRDSDIKIEVWLPVTGWNGKYQAVGNGGWSGSINTRAMAAALERGYATSSTDTGHSGGSASFALGHPEKLTDYAYRSEHEMTVAAKKIIAAYYGDGPRLSYWNGCSAGGKQALKEAQRFPDDFDGIIAGAPAANWVGRAAQSIWVAQAVHKSEASYIPPEKYPLIHAAVLAACDASDGVADGVLEDPTRCQFDPEVLACKDGNATGCLTPAQVEAARKIYSPSINPRTKQPVYRGLERGSELGWQRWGGQKPLSIGLDHFRYVVFEDPNWDFMTLDFDRDIARAQKLDSNRINALDPDLRPFLARGGKLIQYHGWNDPQIAPGNSEDYYRLVLRFMKDPDKVRESYRLFMVPGMGHCGGGEGTSTFDMVAALERWVEENKPPERIVAARVHDGKTDRTRPLCPYPQTAHYTGSGSIDDAANFVCR